MFKFVLGVVAGTFITIIGLSLLEMFNLKVNLSIFTNIVIAIAAVVATTIHFDSRRMQRKDRIWDMNKEILLDLTHSINEVIEETSNELQYEYAIQSQYDDDEKKKRKPYVYKNLDDKISYVLNVYKPLMNNELISSIESYKKTDSNVTRQVFDEGMENIEAYEKMQVERKKLYKDLIDFIGNVSGVKYT